MAVPKAYLTSTKKVGDYFTALQSAQAPKQFTVRFLENLGFKSTSDRLLIGMLKALGFLNASGAPTPRYFEFLDQTQGARVLAEALRDAYGDLFELNVNANKMSRDEVKGKLKTLTQGQFSDDVLGKMANTFTALAAQADFDAVEPADRPDEETPAEEEKPKPDRTPAEEEVVEIGPRRFELGGLVYNIQIQLPESRDAAVYDALFRSLKTHLFSE
jgi:hypothetical protein